MTRIRGDILIDEASLAVERNEDIVLDSLPRLAIQSNYGIAANPAKPFDFTDVDITLDRITILAHGYSTGLKGQFTTTGALPSGISAATDYWIIRVSADTIKVAQTLTDAQNNNPILINSQGTGTHTFTPSAYSGAVIKLQSSNDGLNFVDLPTCIVPITSGGTTIFNVVEPAYRYLRYKYIPSSGSLSLTVILNGYDSQGDINAN